MFSVKNTAILINIAKTGEVLKASVGVGKTVHAI